jgi:hypothetical protein
LNAELLRGETFKATGLQFPVVPEAGINLLKLHGSLDVFTANDGGDLVKIVAAAPGVAAVTDSLRQANEELVYVDPRAPGGTLKALNEIAYADETGEMQFLRRTLLSGAYKYGDRGTQVLPKEMLPQFRQHLNRVQHLACVGYGLGDLHVNEALRRWLEWSETRQLTIVGPAMASLPDFLLHVPDQVMLVDSVASDYFAQFAFAPLSLSEAAFKMIRSEVRKVNRQKHGFA